MGGLAYGFVPRILYRGSSLKFTAFFSSNSRYFRFFCDSKGKLPRKFIKNHKYCNYDKRQNYRRNSTAVAR